MGHHNVAVSKASKRNLTSAAVRLRGCSLASAIVYLFVTDLQEPWSPDMMGILACSTDSEPQISTIQLKQMTLLHYYKYFQIAHLMIHGNIWKPLQLYGRATHGCSFLSRDCRPFWTGSPSLGFNKFLGFWGTRIGVTEATCPSFIVRVDDRYNDPLIDIHDVSKLWSLEEPANPSKKPSKLLSLVGNHWNFGLVFRSFG